MVDEVVILRHERMTMLSTSILSTEKRNINI